MSDTIINIKNSGGVILDTYHMYCDGNIQVKPVLQSKSVIENGSVVADDGYCGLSAVEVSVPPTPTQEKNVTITENGSQTIIPDEGKTLSKVTITVDVVPSSLPTLNAPTIAISDNTLTITNPASNGNFVTKFKVFSDGTALTEAVIKGSTTTVDLSTLLTEAGTYSITAKASAANFNDSAASSAVSYEVAAAGYKLTVTSIGSYSGGSASIVYADGTIAQYITDGAYNNVATVTAVDYNLGGYDLKDSSGGSHNVPYNLTSDTTLEIEYIPCMIEGTRVTLANGTTKAIEGITYDDELLVWNFYDGKFDKAKPKWIKVEQTTPKYCLAKFSNGAEVGFVGPGEHTRQSDGGRGYHRIFNKEAGAFTYVGTEETPNGTTTFAQDGTFPTVVSQEVVEKEVKFYNVITDKHYNLFANGILTSCRLSNKYRIEDMRYVGEKLISDEQEKAYFERIENKRK